MTVLKIIIIMNTTATSLVEEISPLRAGGKTKIRRGICRKTLIVTHIIYT